MSRPLRMRRARRGRRVGALRAGVLAVVLGLAVLAPALAAADEPADGAADRRALTLGEHFYGTHQYYRAVGSFEELRLFTNDPGLRLHAGLRIAMAYHLGQQTAEAVAAYDAVLQDGGAPSDLAGFVRLQRVLARAQGIWLAEELVPTSDLIGELRPLERRADAPFRPLAAYHLARLHVVEGDLDAATEVVERNRAACAARPVPDCEVLARLAAPLATPPFEPRRPLVGMSLSILVPGLGSVYAGRPFDALYYFGLTTGAGLMAWNVYDDRQAFADQKASFYALSLLAATFYASSVAQGWLATAYSNEVRAYRRRVDLLRKTELPLPLDAPGRLPAGAPAPER